MSTPTYAIAARELLRNTLLDAARQELQARRWGEITMAAIAATAGVSRQTLYNEFGSREQFAGAFLLRESDRFLGAVEAAVSEHLDDPGTALSAAFDVFLTAAAEDPLVHTLLFGDAGYLLPLLTAQGRPVVEHASERLAQIMVSGWPQVSFKDAQLLAESLVRLAISYAVLPSGPSSISAASMTRLLEPYIEKVLAETDR